MTIVNLLRSILLNSSMRFSKDCENFKLSLKAFLIAKLLLCKPIGKVNMRNLILSFTNLESLTLYLVLMPINKTE
jgi:hypothetical protein